MKDIRFYFDEGEQREYREILQDKSREELIEIATAATKRYWDAYDIAESLYDRFWVGLVEEEESLRELLSGRLEGNERELRYLDEFSEYFGRQKKYPQEQE